jgi:hypothetical protein
MIDKVLAKLGQHKLRHSIAVKAMFPNCLSFTYNLLYIYSQYLEILLIKKLLAPGSSASNIIVMF